MSSYQLTNSAQTWHYVHMKPGRKRTYSARQRLEQALALAEWNFAELAAYLGVGRSAVTQWLNGSKRPNLEHLVKIEKRFKIPVSSWL